VPLFELAGLAGRDTLQGVSKRTSLIHFRATERSLQRAVSYVGREHLRKKRIDV
jgi:hypothetical protein